MSTVAPIVITRLIDSYVVLVLANTQDPDRGMPIEKVPEFKTIGGVQYAIRSEVEIIVAEKTIGAIG